MCDPVSAIIGIGTAVGAYTGYRASEDAAEAAEQQAEARQQATQTEAANIQAAAELEVQQLYRDAVKYRSAQVARQGAAGVMVGAGSTQQMIDETTRLAEQDALVMLENAERGILAKREEGRLARMVGEANANAYQAQGIASIARGITGIASLWT